jgi:2-dehydropantoate 2-reductase
MRILIVGAGGIGGLLGAWLLHAGRDVTFLVRPPTALRLEQHGLTLESPNGNLHLPHPQTILARDLKQASDLRQPYDLILLSCKSYDLPAAIADFAPAVGPSTRILPMLNGMAHMALLDQHFGRAHVLGGHTLLSAARDEQGRILHLNPLDDVYLGDRDHPASTQVQQVAQALTVSGFTTHLSPNIEYAMWQKWVAIATAAGITCLMRAPVGDIVAAGAEPYIAALLEEAAAIATAAGFPPQQEFLTFTRKRFTVPGSLFTTSMHRDIEAGAPVEAQQIIGDLLDHGLRLNLSTPLLSIANAHLRSYQQRRLREQARA